MNEIVVVFPGQGSQYDGMGQAQYEAHQGVRDCFAQASEVLGYSLEDLCFRGAPGELTRTHHAQASILVLSYAMYQVFQESSPVAVDFMTGHSLGELTALAASGAISFTDAVRLVKVRGEAMEECARSTRTGMVAVIGLESAEVDALKDEFNAGGHALQVANYNSDTQTVLGGTIDEVERFTALLDARGHRSARLNVAGAFHSSHMAPAVPAFVAAVEQTEIVQPTVPVVSSVTGRAYTSVEEIRETLAVQLTEPVRWRDVVAGLAERDVRLWIECGPKKVLSKLVAAVVGEDRVRNLDQDADGARAAVEDVLAHRRTEPSFPGLCLGAVAATRNRNFDKDAYATGVLAPYRELQELAGRHEDPRGFTTEEKESALRLLRTILDTKGVPSDEQADRIQQILRRSGTPALVG